MMAKDISILIHRELREPGELKHILEAKTSLSFLFLQSIIKKVVFFGQRNVGTTNIKCEVAYECYKIQTTSQSYGKHDGIQVK